METGIPILTFYNGLESNTAIFQSVSELVYVKLKAPNLSIKAAEKREFLNLSSSFHYNQITALGKLFIEGKISLNDFLPHTTINTRIMDATYFKREGKKVYGAKKIKNYINGSYEQLQDVLFTTENRKGLNKITDFKIINHNKRHLTKPQEIVKVIREGKIRKGDWLVIDEGLKSKEIMREARKAGVKVVTRLNSNFVVLHFGMRFKKEDIIEVIKPIKRTINGKEYIIYEFKRCIWQGTAGNLFLIRGEGYDDFVALFTTSLRSKPETVIRKYNERTQIEQTNKEMKSYLGAEGNHKRKKESNYGYIFIVSLVYNLVQAMRLFLKGKSFKDVLEELSFYLLWKDPPKSVFSLDWILNPIFENSMPEVSNKINIVEEGAIAVLEKVAS